MFWKKNNQEQVSLDQLNVEVVKWKAEIERLEQQLKSLRGLVNKKLGNDEIRETESIKNSDGFDNLRGLSQNGIGI